MLKPFLDFPIFATNRLHLREISHEQAEGLFNLLTNAEVTRYYPVIKFASAQDCLQVIDMFSLRYRQQEEIRWGVFLAGGNNLIGIVALQNLTHSGKATLVFALHPAYWRQGFATEAICAVTAWGFEQLGLSCIDAEVIPGNVVSERILVKSGFVFTGFYSEKLEWNNKKYDINSYVLTPDCLPNRTSVT